ncbi:MAG: ECF transporter S component, partial [Lachnospiraceae bacterium]|nr:ECF transporter S component [Lachnospiraceae bacterium]
LQQRKYYFISLLLVLEALGAFFVSFEKGKPKLKEMMTISVMTAITVAGRAVFYMVPNVKPMAALTILSGIGLGGEAGFLVGSLSMLVSNIFFGQGPWTPWQMAAMGLLGWLAGIIFRNESSCSWKKVGVICVFGFLSVLLVYGGIMNPASVLMYQEHVNRAMILSAYAMGVPFDLLHAGGTVIFLLIGTRPILKKLFRIQKGGN